MENYRFFQEDNKFQENDKTTWAGTATTNWQSVEKDAKNKDPKAQALMELRREGIIQKEKLEGISKTTRDELNIYKKDLEIHRKDLKRIDRIMIGIVIFVVVSFMGTFFLLVFDQIKEKDLYLNYSNLYQNYSEKNSQLKDVINEQKIEVNNLKKDFEILKAKNSLK